MSTEAEKKAVRKYQAKCKEVRIKYTEKEISEYNRFARILIRKQYQSDRIFEKINKSRSGQKGVLTAKRAGIEG